MSLITTLVGPVTGLLDKFIEDKDQKAALAHEIATMGERHSQEALLSQLEINKAEAASGSLFVGWICGFALLYHFILCPVIIFIVTLTGAVLPPLPEFDMGSLMTVLLGMLGIGGLRTYEKQKGLTK
jgi:hypothetical protein